MASDEEIARIRKMDRNALLQFWGQIEAGDTPEWEKGTALEHFFLRGFELEGALVRWPFDVKLQETTVEQVDGALHVGPLHCLVESKDTVKPKNVEPIAKMRSKLLRRPGPTIGIVFSRSGFTEPAKILASFMAPQTILLWSGEETRLALEKARLIEGLEWKYRHAIEEGLPDFDLRRKLPA